MKFKEIISKFFKIKMNEKAKLEAYKTGVDLYFLLLGEAELISKMKGWRNEIVSLPGGARLDVIDKEKNRVLSVLINLYGRPRYTPGVFLRGRRYDWERVEPDIKNLKFLMYEDE